MSEICDSKQTGVIVLTVSEENLTMHNQDEVILEPENFIFDNIHFSSTSANSVINEVTNDCSDLTNDTQSITLSINQDDADCSDLPIASHSISSSVNQVVNDCSDIPITYQSIKEDINDCPELQNISQTVASLVTSQRNETIYHDEDECEDNIPPERLFELKPHACNHCSYRSAHPVGVAHHIRNVHKKIKSHVCILCPYKASKRYHMIRHIQHKHRNSNQSKYNDALQFNPTKVEIIELAGIQNKPRRVMKKTHACKQCDYTSVYKRSVISHIKSVHMKSGSYGCHRCSYSTPIQGNLYNHIRTKHFKEKMFVCDECPYKASKTYGLKIHKQNKHPQFTQSFVQSTPSIPLTESHKDLLAAAKTYNAILSKVMFPDLTQPSSKSYMCNLCTFRATVPASVFNHLRTVHKKVQTYYACDQCTFSSRRKFDILKHNKLNHSGKGKPRCFNTAALGTNIDGRRVLEQPSKGYKCNRCSYRATKPTLMIDHFRKVHQKLQYFVCNECSYESTTKDDAMRHIRIVHKKTEMRCHSNTSQFDHQQQQESVQDANVTGDEAIDDCNNLLDGDLVEEKPCLYKKTSYVCDHCSFRTSLKEDLACHIESVHNENNPHICDVCSYSFVHRDHLIQHKRTVHGNKSNQYSCSLCSYKTMQSGFLVKHISLEHNRYNIHRLKKESQ